MIETRNTKIALTPIPMVRYKFGRTANIYLHFHEIDGRSLFYYPSDLPYRDGQWVFVEFAVAGSAVPCMARGRLQFQQSARFLGSWFEFPTPDLPAVMKNLARSRRTRERIPVDLTVMIRRGDGMKVLCRVSDVSAKGIRLSGLPCLLNTGEELSLELLGMPRSQSLLGSARVTWVRMQEAGLQLADAEKGCAALTSIVQDAVAARPTSVEYAHHESCGCKSGVRPSEPPLPNTSSRKSRLA
jgi:PilZ domain